jgi:beta-galactosidase/beta-glucuronidase
MPQHQPRPEYPRPQWTRAEWANLNGEWEFQEDPGLSGERKRWGSGVGFSQRILVPFAPESRLSGIAKTDFMPCVWYRRSFEVPAEWEGKRVWLHFGAVDYEATVWLNGAEVGRHRGGYTPFSCELTSHLRAGPNELVVRAADDTRSPLQPSGKQSDKPESYGCRYTRTTGIWQTVWLEATPQAFLDRARMIPDLDGGRLLIQLWLGGSTTGLRVIATAKAGTEVVGAAEARADGGFAMLCLDIESPRAWSPEDPFLYELVLVLVEGAHSGAPLHSARARSRGDLVIDRVESYFGLRKVHLEAPAICLNNRPVFQRLVLDQGFYPDGVYTAPSDEALRRDIELSQAMGFNGARLHQKVFEPRFMYWADKLGYLCWGEFADWGLNYSHPEALESFLPQWLEAVERDFNHPSIVGWCPFNETNDGQRPELLRQVRAVTKAVDPTRPVIDTSGYVHVETDVDDCHDYNQDPAQLAEHFRAFASGGEPWRNSKADAPHRGQPFFVSEYGGIWWNPGQTDENAWGYGERPKSEQEFLARYRGLTEALLFHPRMCGFCYTQLYDIEQEVNGLYTYDRKAKFQAELIRQVNQQRAAIEA